MNTPWAPETWRKLPVQQMPAYGDLAKLGVVEGSVDVGKLNRIVQGGTLPDTRRVLLADRTSTVIAAGALALVKPTVSSQLAVRMK